MNSNNVEDFLQEKIAKSEATIEAALWASVNDQNYDKELESYSQAKSLLLPLPSLPPRLERERSRVLSDCRM